MAKGRAGISGSAVLFGTAGLYLVYVGVKDVPFFDGLRAILRKERPTPSTTHAPYVLPAVADITVGALAGFDAVTSGDLGLVGNAASALQQWRQLYPNLNMLGRGERPTPNSDHPKGKAIDIMTTDNSTAQNIIRIFKTQPGAKYWIWSRQQGHIAKLWIPTRYTGDNPHTDHVHLSYF